MLSHMQVWAAIDELASRQAISVSRLARNAGLDPTTFNPSKRTGVDGRPRWPSTESIAKVIEASATSLGAFSALVDGDVDQHRMSEGAQSFYVPPQGDGGLSIPLIGLAQAGTGGFFDDAGLPRGEGWDAVAFPQPDGEQVYALEVSGDSMEPAYRDGDRIIVSPTATVRRGDRVVVRTRGGEVMAKVLARETLGVMELESLNPAHAMRTVERSDVEWVARILWASQ